MQDNELKEFNTKDILKRNVDMKKYIEELLASLKVFLVVVKFTNIIANFFIC